MFSLRYKRKNQFNYIIIPVGKINILSFMRDWEINLKNPKVFKGFKLKI